MAAAARPTQAARLSEPPAGAAPHDGGHQRSDGRDPAPARARTGPCLALRRAWHPEPQPAQAGPAAEPACLAPGRMAHPAPGRMARPAPGRMARPTAAPLACRASRPRAPLASGRTALRAAGLDVEELVAVGVGSHAPCGRGGDLEAGDGLVRRVLRHREPGPRGVRAFRELDLEFVPDVEGGGLQVGGSRGRAGRRAAGSGGACRA